MTIRQSGVSAVTVGDLLQQALRIPPYQRPYSWEPATALQLLDDIEEARQDSGRRDTSYVLGAVILHQQSGHLDVVDGQQRLITLRMLLAMLGSKDFPLAPPEGQNPIALVWRVLQERIGLFSAETRSETLAFVLRQCQFVRVVTDDIDEAFRVFDSQNYRGRPLAPHDLLKAYHLREMRDETAAMRAAVVESWEAVRDEDLDRLFANYLCRIARWSRGESARGFGPADVGMFKGISVRRGTTISPHERYHVAAQAALPMLSAWGVPAGLGERSAGRCRFQLDAPLMAGRPSFEMVTFMLGELRRLTLEAFQGEAKRFCIYDLIALDECDSLQERPSQSRYRYVCELYLAAVLHYTNKFGDDGWDYARARLFAWAYAPRVELTRVQFRSVDNRARGERAGPSAFVLMRNAANGKCVSELPRAEPTDPSGRESRLVELLSQVPSS